MEDGRTQVEMDEFEKLLGEIPNVTSGNPHSEESGRKRVSLNESLSSVCVNSHKGSFTDKHQNNGNSNEGKVLANHTQQLAIKKRVQPDEANLSNGLSLTSAFAELSFDNGDQMLETVSPPLTICKSSPNQAVLLNCQYPNSLKNSISNVDSRVMIIPNFQTPNKVSVPCGFDGFDVTRVGQESSDFSKLDAQEIKKWQVGHCQPIDNLSAALSLPHETQSFQFLSNVPAPVPGVEFPLLSEHQQYFADVQSSLPYLHAQQLNRSHICWRNIEEEQCYRMHQQYLYMQQLRNQQMEAQPPIQTNGNVVTRMMSRNLCQPYLEVPISHEQSNPESLWNNFPIPRVFNQLNPAVSYSDYNARHVFDKVSKHSLPEKILTRSDGLNTLKTMKFGSTGGNELLTPAQQNGKIISNSHFCHSLSTPNARRPQLDGFRTWTLSPDIADLKSTNLRTLSQKYNSVDEVTGRIYFMAKDQHGCRFLQRKFSEGTPEDVGKIFLEIMDHIVELMTDPFGNYLVQKLLEVCDEEQRMQILQAITQNTVDLVKISCDMHGTRAVQKVIETLKTAEQFSMVVSSLKPGIVTLIKNMNGNHVAQRCLQYLMPEYSKFIFEAATTNCVELATDRHGCCVLQKCLSHSDGEQRRHLVYEITSNALILSQDPFGNYVVQYVFELRLPWATADILDQFEGNYGDLSVQKYSSNVVEKCLKYAGEERRAHIIQELMSNVRLEQIMQDPYGNYVIQAALHQSKGVLHSALVEAIRPHVPVLRTSPYGKKVLSCISLKK